MFRFAMCGLVRGRWCPQVTFKGDGELGELQAVSTASGQVKGKVINPAGDPPLRPDGKLDVGAAVGGGFLAVVRNHPSSAQPYTGAPATHLHLCAPSGRRACAIVRRWCGWVPLFDDQQRCWNRSGLSFKHHCMASARPRAVPAGDQCNAESWQAQPDPLEIPMGKAGGHLRGAHVAGVQA